MNKQNSATNRDSELDALLSQWAERHALSPEQANAIHAAVLAQAHPHVASLDAHRLENIELPYEWWGRFSGDLTASMQQPLNSRFDRAFLKNILLSNSVHLSPVS